VAVLVAAGALLVGCGDGSSSQPTGEGPAADTTTSAAVQHGSSLSPAAAGDPGQRRKPAKNDGREAKRTEGAKESARTRHNQPDRPDKATGPSTASPSGTSLSAGDAAVRAIVDSFDDEHEPSGSVPQPLRELEAALKNGSFSASGSSPGNESSSPEEVLNEVLKELGQPQG
jgi:hypothetical protein